jgi:hypothetical protein
VQIAKVSGAGRIAALGKHTSPRSPQCRISTDANTLKRLSFACR